MSAVSVVMTTVADDRQASEMSAMLVSQRLAACVQKLPIGSCYRWNGQVTEESEVLLLIKTAAERVDEAVAAIKQQHPYDLPEVVVLPTAGALESYADWVKSETRPGDGRPPS